MIILEYGFDYEIIRKLMQMGHKVGYGLGGDYQAIWYDAEKKTTTELRRAEKMDKRQGIS